MHRTRVNHPQTVANKETFRTPMYVWDGLLDQFPAYFTGRVLDASAGDGRLIGAILDRGNHKRHRMYDIRPEERQTWRRNGLFAELDGQCYIKDFLLTRPRPRYDALVTNPPFSIAVPFVEHGLKWVKADGHVLILHRLNWLGTFRRSQWLKQMPLKEVLVIAKRPTWEVDSRPNNSSDTYEYAFFVFQKGYLDAPTVNWIF